MCNLEKEIEDFIKDDFKIDILDYSIIYINGYFKIYTDLGTPSYWHPVGGSNSFEDMTYQRYETFTDAFRGVKELIQNHETDNKDSLIEKQEEYIKFLATEIEKTASYLWIHGMLPSEEVIQLGIKLRGEIKELKDKIILDNND